MAVGLFSIAQSLMGGASGVRIVSMSSTLRGGIRGAGLSMGTTGRALPSVTRPGTPTGAQTGGATGGGWQETMMEIFNVLQWIAWIITLL